MFHFKSYELFLLSLSIVSTQESQFLKFKVQISTAPPPATPAKKEIKLQKIIIIIMPSTHYVVRFDPILCAS